MSLELLILINMLCYIVFFGPTPLQMLWLATGHKLQPFFVLIILIVYASTSLWAVHEAKRLRFREYELSVITNTITAGIGCFWLWFFCFPWFLANRYRILHGKATQRKAVRKNLSVPFILFLVTSPFLALLGAMVIPSLFQSRTQAGEANAITCLRNYHTAQLIFSSDKSTIASGNANQFPKYCNNFRNLYYEKTKTGDCLKLLPKEFADAFAAPTHGMIISEEYTIEASPYKGYLFIEDSIMAESGNWDGNFSLVAYPSEPGWGESIFWIDVRGQIFWSKTEPKEGPRPQLLRPDESPLFPNCTRKWETL